ncbi:hypothetical protein EW146_g9280 [Bondarzewia mesenterica]|uniref:HAT C-terminal dimerisation domain-containing protein n=1 Tax=Bondarzewia mesenterica TaxID=1095465 RepID=A0A4S4L822_9AGAM|nr:hypothetical protein EW146_g9280 [Bondarzewia mesenterica]
MIAGSGQEVYLTTFFLTPTYINSAVLRRYEQNPCSTGIRLQRSSMAASYISPSNQASTASTMHSQYNDDDVIAAVPCYTKIIRYFSHIFKTSFADAPSKLLEHFSNPQEMWNEFHQQLAMYARQEYPFNQQMLSSPMEYWKRLSHHNLASLLAYIAIRLFSLCPNSMAEERTVSNFTKLNLANRNRQKASTLVHMTRIKQHYMHVKKKSVKKLPLTVKFRDLAEHLQLENQSRVVKSGSMALGSIIKVDATSDALNADAAPMVGGPDSAASSVVDSNAALVPEDEEDQLQYLWDELQEHEVIECSHVEGEVFDVEQGDAESSASCATLDGTQADIRTRIGGDANLADPLLLDMLSDAPVGSAAPSSSEKHHHSGAQSTTVKASAKTFDFTSIDFGI